MATFASSHSPSLGYVCSENVSRITLHHHISPRWERRPPLPATIWLVQHFPLEGASPTRFPTLARPPISTTISPIQLSWPHFLLEGLTHTDRHYWPSHVTDARLTVGGDSRIAPTTASRATSARRAGRSPALRPRAGCCLVPLVQSLDAEASQLPAAEAPGVYWPPPPTARAIAARRETDGGAASQLAHASPAEPPFCADRAHARARVRWRSSAGGAPPAPRCTWGTSAGPLHGDRNYGSSAALSVAGTLRAVAWQPAIKAVKGRGINRGVDWHWP